MDRIGILIDLVGKDAALNSLEQLRKLVNDLKEKRLNIKLDKANINSEINDIRHRIRFLEQEKIRIRADKAEIRAVNK